MQRPTAPPIASAAWRRRRLLALGAGLPLLGACASMLQSKEPRRFRLDGPTRFAPDLPTVAWTLEVDQTVADPGIDTTRIAAIGSAGIELEYFADAEWPSRASDMVTTMLLQAFVDSSRIARVGDRNSGLRPDFVLKTVLRDFQVERSGTPSVKVTMTASLVELPRRIQAGMQRFQSTAPVASSAIEDIVRGFETALDRVLADLVAWTLITGNGTHPPTG
ncbi:MAG TPA: ABC-type transport auxiliary lipoprotein family protein [Candidatus Sulfotelmatobacter sp.]|nr:ABC-type transport auxiliary lipoprotein family protein [Candidatus Sulfotelmatobacter sp.]